ncbi:MAG: L-ribulose-5-phosphate 3-epimerase [Atopobiaceae bacterium]|jgi:L-ribulose-5-phosphate 3-epimerase/hexulose-6-phosphate isomerase|nr:L-ribulose-5-phosphate 3-epimerase [Atopobiaceae bacterium]MDD2588277.1 L-ribulose-5-phosphate 3-epimerase [Atopobiaceae bacterium]MDD3486494.1 L-ribulose-5-phosphate 3-epimerase [Atopobiaceae bacterium]
MSEQYLLGMYEKALPAELGWSERLSEARKAGFDYVEMSIDETDERLTRLDWSITQRRDLTHMMDETGVPVGSICLSGLRRFPFGHPDKDVRYRSLKVMGDTINLASDLGIRIIMIPGYDVYYEKASDETRVRFLQTLSRAVDMAAYAGVSLGFETMETPFMDTVGKAMHYVDLVDSPYLGVYPDLGNVSNACLATGESVAKDIRKGAGHIFAAHCKETSEGRYREVPYGTGTTDYEGSLLELARMGVRRYVAEFWYTGSEAWRDDAGFASTFVRRRIDAAFDEVLASATCVA